MEQNPIDPHCVGSSAEPLSLRVLAKKSFLLELSAEIISRK